MLQAQSSIRPLDAEVEIRIPEGMVVTGLIGPVELVDEVAIRWRGDPGPRTEIGVEFSATPGGVGMLLRREILRIGGNA